MPGFVMSRAHYAQAMVEMCIVSGGDRVRYQSYLNHKAFAVLSGMDYRLEVGPLPEVTNKYFFKVRAVLDILPRYDWVVWVDDDAFITDFSRTTFFTDLASKADAKGEFFVVADGPRLLSGAWTKINSGVFMVKNEQRSVDLLKSVLATNLDLVLEWWNPDAYGQFSGGDQDAFVYWMQASGAFDNGGVRIVSQKTMNARPWQYDLSVEDCFIVHFPGMKSKRRAMAEFTKRFELTEAFLPASIVERFNIRPTPRRNYIKLAIGQAKYQVQKRKLAHERT